MTADELDTAAIRRRLVPPLTGSGQTEFAREVGEALCRLCDALDAARAAGGVQPAPDTVSREAVTAVHGAFEHAADRLETLGGSDDRLRRSDVVAWLRAPAVAAGKLLDDLKEDLALDSPRPGGRDGGHDCARLGCVVVDGRRVHVERAPRPMLGPERAR